MWANLHGDPAEWHETIHVHVRNVGCMRVERLSVTNYKIIYYIRFTPPSKSHHQDIPGILHF